MIRKSFFILAPIAAFFLGPRVEACSTFMLERGDTVLIGHNLDEYIPMPGLIIINPRGVSKHGIGWGGFLNPLRPAKPQLTWVSRYASVTYNAFGREFPDGGMNEAGLYVGEMSYWFTEYPKFKGAVRLYHHHWVQYLLDNYASVGQVLAVLERVVPDGHCRWQFFVTDSSGAVATITFVKGRAVVNTGDSLPVRVLCNRRYAREMDTLRLYQGFGGSRAVDIADTSDDRRFVRAAEMLRSQDRRIPAADYALAMLRQLDLGNNKWSLAFDLKGHLVYFNTDRSRRMKSFDLAAFDLSPEAPAMVLDINRDIAGNVTDYFTPYSEAVQREYVSKMWNVIDAGLLGDLMFKPIMKSRMISQVRDIGPKNK